jgi:hypothetical protein
MLWGSYGRLYSGVAYKGFKLGLKLVNLYTGVPSKGYTLEFPLKVIPWGSLVRALVP